MTGGSSLEKLAMSITGHNGEDLKVPSIVPVQIDASNVKLSCVHESLSYHVRILTP